MDLPPSPPKPSRGGQPGNKNALSYGFYASPLNETDLTDLDEWHFSGLLEEIALLRVYIRHVVKLSANAQTLEEAESLLRVLSLACIRLSGLITIQKIFGNRFGEVGLEIDEAKRELYRYPPVLQKPEK